MQVLALVLAMQFVVTVKAGLVNHVQGMANVAEMEMAKKDRPIRTGEDGYVEVLLTPGSFLRLGEHSEAILEGVELDNVSVRVVSGSAVIEVLQIGKDHPLHIASGELRVDIAKAGIYKFLDGTATVVAGELRASSGKAYGKGWMVAFNGTFSANKAGKLASTSLDVYSQSRSAEIARVNLSLAASLRQVSGPPNFWLYDPSFRMYTFMPFSNFRSSYGYRYYAPGQVDRPSYTNNSGGYSGSGPSGNSGNTNSGNSNSGGSNSGNTGGGGGGGAPAERVLITPQAPPPPPPPPPVTTAPVVAPNPTTQQ